MGTHCHIQTYDIRRAIENLPDYPCPGTEAAKAKATGTDGNAIPTGKPLTEKRRGIASLDSLSVSASGTPREGRELQPVGMVDSRKGLSAVGLDTKKDLLSPPDNESFKNGPARIRTSDQWIMSPKVRS